VHVFNRTNVFPTKDLRKQERLIAQSRHRSRAQVGAAGRP